MAGTDAFVDGAVAPSLDVEVRKEIQRLRKLLINPNEVHLVTRRVPTGVTACTDDCCGEYNEERWLTDRYIMVNVTGSLVLKATGAEGGLPGMGEEFPDFGYKLMASKGLVLKEDAFLPDTVGLIDSIERPGEWERLYRTQWSMADSEAKLMLAYTKRATEWCSNHYDVAPYAVNEEIWVAFEEAFAYPGDTEVIFETCEDRPYRVSLKGKVVGYIARASFPNEVMREDAGRVARAVANR